MLHPSKSGYLVLLLLLLLCLGLYFPNTTLAENSKSSGVFEFQVQVVPGVERHLEILEYPPILVAALENNGIRSSNSGRIIIRDLHTIEFKNTQLKFLKRVENVFHYQMSYDLVLLAEKKRINLLMEVDASQVTNGKINVTMHFPYLQMILQNITDRIEMKILSLTPESYQKKVITYLDALANKQPKPPQIHGLISSILVDSYNLPAQTTAQGLAKQPGDAEPVGDQLLLIATIIIWGVMLPGMFLVIFLWRKRRFKKLENQIPRP